MHTLLLSIYNLYCVCSRWLLCFVAFNGCYRCNGIANWSEKSSDCVVSRLLHAAVIWFLWFFLSDGRGAAEEIPELSDGDDDDLDDDEEQWQWMEEDSQPVTCLFCDRRVYFM